MLTVHFLLEYLIKTLLMLLWMNTKVWDLIWRFITFFWRIETWFWRIYFVFLVLWAALVIMEKIKALNAKKASSGRT